ncbi:hypothetical protein GW16_08030 [Xanthomonas arboricola pv. celebensis]|nr:hypothetical protein GW16_08030 [Xanthomonas arboricola pv. celebensis]
MSKTGAQRCARVGVNCYVDAPLSTWPLSAAALQSSRCLAQLLHAVFSLLRDDARLRHCNAFAEVTSW